MKNLVKIVLLFVITIITSCSSDDPKAVGEYAPVMYPMKGSLDGEASKLMRNFAGTNRANPNSVEFGFIYFTLNAFFDNSSQNAKAPIQDRIVEVNLVIPKENVVLGEHLFNNSLVVDEYYADVNIKTNNVVETVNTVSGKINVITFDDLTGKITGTFELTTTNGTDPASHTFSGEFDYLLIDN